MPFDSYRGNGRAGGFGRRDNGVGFGNGAPRVGGRNSVSSPRLGSSGRGGGGGLALFDRNGRRVDPREVAAMLRRGDARGGSRGGSKGGSRRANYGSDRGSAWEHPDQEEPFGDGPYARRIGFRF